MVARRGGDFLLQYRLVEKIGEGGMGSVWRAEDTTLGRHAAIKLLPDDLAADAQFLARFEREAKLLASLSHPNLAAVYGVHEADGTRFLAMEYVPGEDLSQRLRRGPLTLEQTIGTMTRIAEALESAHAKGVVHRDLKPANIRLTPEGRVKVLDFGLAKSMQGDAAAEVESDSNVALTATGVVLGTAPYMSPEQARGQPVDARTDIWSFGCVLWECLTGERLARGDSVPDLVVSILNDEPDWAKLPPGLPPAMHRLLRRCLAKSRRERLHHAADARLELEEAAAESRSTGTPAVAGPPSARWRQVAWPLACLAVVFAMIPFAMRQRAAPPPAKPLLSDATFRWLTIDAGEEVDSAISPNGEFLAYLSDREKPGVFHAYAGRIGSDEFVKLDLGAPIQHAKYLQAGVRRMGFRHGGDGLWLAGGSDMKLQMVTWPALQTSPWLERGVVHTDWSPDGRRIVYSLAFGGDPMFVADADGTDPVRIPLDTQDGYHQHFPTWSTDGKWLYVSRGTVIRGEMDLWRVRPDGRDLEQLTSTIRDVAFPVAIDDRTVAFIGRERDGTGPWLWELDVETKRPQRASTVMHAFKALSGSRGGRRLVASVAKPEAGLYTVPILEGKPATEREVREHPLKAVRAVAPCVAGDRLYYLSSTGGADGLKCVRDSKSEWLWKPSGFRRIESAPAASPDGSLVAIVVRDDRRAQLVLLNPDGTEPRDLADDVDVVGGASWSPDGRWIAVGGVRNGEKGLFKVRAEDGRVELIKAVEAMNPVWSPDDRLIIFAGAQVGPGQRLFTVAPDGSPSPVPFPSLNVAVYGERVRFLPGRPAVVVMMGFDPNYEFRLFELDRDESRSLVKFESSASVRAFDITPDGKTIVFDRQRDNADIVLIELGAQGPATEK